MFGEKDTFVGIETKLALERFIKFFDILNNQVFLELSYDYQEDIVKNVLLKKEKAQISQIIIFGSENCIDDFKKYFGKAYIKINLLTKLCHEYYVYFPIPFDIKELLEALRNSKSDKNPFLNLEKIHTGFKRIFSDSNDYKNFLGKNDFDFFMNAGEKLTTRTDSKASKIEHHGKESEAPLLKNKFLSQIFDLAYASIMHSTESKQFNILWIDNNPERELSNIDERFKEFIKSKLKLEDLLYEIENTFENYSFYIYDKGKHLNSFKELKKYLETQGKRAKKLFARTPLKKEYIQISLKDFDFILIDIFIGEKFDGIDLLKLFTIHFPEIPAFVLSVSDDYDTIASAIQEGADYYILKTQVLSIPYLYYQYLEKLGGIISLLEK